MQENNEIGCNNCKIRHKTIFSELSFLGIEQLNQIKKCIVIKKGEMLFTEGSYPKGLYCVESGKLKVSQIGIDGKEQILHLIHNGDVMGYRAIFSEDTYSCSATALEESHICFIPKTDFYKMVESSPKLALKIAHLLSVELKNAEQKITQMAHLPVKNRVANVLINLILNYGLKEDNVTINLIVKREDISNLAGTTRETATRILYDLQEQNIIQLNGKNIKILDEKKLLKMSQFT